MDPDNISVISIESKGKIEDNQKEKGVPKENYVSRWNILHVISILGFGVIFLTPWTLIPRTNSVAYQSHWFEINASVMMHIMLAVANIALNLATYFKEPLVFSFKICLRMYLLIGSMWIVPYLIGYWMWCSYFENNWPLPMLGYLFFIVQILFIFGMWIIFPQNLRKKDNIKNDIQIYKLYVAVVVMMTGFKEGLSLLLKLLPLYLQWIIALLIPILKGFELKMQSSLVRRMAGGQDEPSAVLLGLSVNAEYSFFIAARLPAVETVTVCFIIAIELLLQLHITYRIFKTHQKLVDFRIGKCNLDMQRLVSKLVLAEATEGLTPLMYALGFAMAYYGPNASILGNVKNGYWGYEKVEDIGYLFQMMLLLFGVDVLSVLINFLILSTWTNVKLFQEFSRIMKEYWLFMAIKFGFKMCNWFVLKDINFGMDSTGNWNWITDEGRYQLIGNSTDLPHEEKPCF